jgi:hypothetical protein
MHCRDPISFFDLASDQRLIMLCFTYITQPSSAAFSISPIAPSALLEFERLRQLTSWVFCRC